MTCIKIAALKRSETWRYVTLKPGVRPLDTLAVELAKLQQGDLSQALNLSHQLAESDRSFFLALELLLDRAAGQRLVLMVDQFEALWTLAPLNNEALQGHTSFIHSLAFSPDGKLLASGSWDTTIQLWDVKSQRCLGEPLQGHTKHVNSVAFSPDGTILASRSSDATIRLWDVASQQLIGESFQGLNGSIGSETFSADGRTLISFDGAATIRLWDISPQSSSERACRIAGRNLSMDEWVQFIGSERPYERTCPQFPPGEGAPSTAQ